MADIYVKPYRGRPAPWKVILWIAVLAAVAAGLWFWLAGRSEEVPRQETDGSPVVQESPAAVESTAASRNNAEQARQLFSRAQNLAASGSLQSASELLDEVIAGAADESLVNNAIRVQGRINLQLFLSGKPTAQKKSYVIQPGDSLDKIARQNKTTVDLIRRMNNIKGNLIYPGGRLLLPAEPLVVRVDKSEKTLDLTLGNKRLKRYAVGLGMNGKTPLGIFHTVVHQTNPDWTPPGGGIVPFGDPRNVLGTRWISIQDDTRPELRGFGIHGTSERDSIGGETSNGCVRMLNEDVEELFMLIPRGTEVIISE